jgi:hypothetical protein
VGGRRAAAFTVVSAVVVSALAACSDAPSTSQVNPAAALTAIVRWQADAWTPPPDAEADLLPVIYVVAAGGGTIDVGVQADVTASMADEAVVRFADEPAEAFDTGVEGAPVHDDGILLAVGEVPEPARRVTIEVDRYVAQDDAEMMSVDVTARRPSTSDPRAAEVTATEDR